MKARFAIWPVVAYVPSAGIEPAAFLVAGHETSAGVLAFALYELAQHREVAAEARAELDARFTGTAHLLHEFEFEPDPAYQLDIAEQITLKPRAFTLRLRRR